jgi:hypothetical protein
MHSGGVLRSVVILDAAEGNVPAGTPR